MSLFTIRSKQNFQNCSTPFKGLMLQMCFHCLAILLTICILILITSPMVPTLILLTLTVFKNKAWSTSFGPLCSYSKISAYGYILYPKLIDTIKFTPESVHEELIKQQSDKTYGPDNITAHLLKIGVGFLCSLLSNFPLTLACCLGNEVAHIIPVYKKAINIFLLTIVLSALHSLLLR